MRKVTKNSNPPSVIFVQKRHKHFNKEKWKVLTEKVCSDFDTDPVPFQKGNYNFSQDFGYDEFRIALKGTIGSKCCYCEKGVAEGEIEHFRPKAAYKIGDRHQLVQPGYYWLAYDWDNMLLSCGECNDQKRKGNLFPLKKESNRATDRSMNISKESPILINPSKEDPSKFISFHLENPIGIDKLGRGDKVINILELDSRGDLIEERRNKLKLYRFAKKIANLVPGDFSQQDIDDSKVDCAKYLDLKEPFSGMLVENIKNNLI
jgi:uncharacterized protein (TIGR02646 family)